ncbi:MAG: phosphoenolpyruvate--protein phosphotransferase, partial [Ignavibacteria bacterium]|nr:phosphoenolpyruvate--protein phosphotransferase [Ignavibacteria bacterium]
GLYRSEEMFFEKGTFPNEAEQIERYLAFVERIYPETIVIRTFDIGGDKVLPEAELERNPFLGWRGIRMMLDKKDEFLTQVKAILKCSFHRNVKIMFPMVSVLEEIIEAKKLVEIAKDELKSQNLKFDENIQIGMMAEVPSVICCMDEFAKEVDFVSVGTNDLIQYLLAVDRGNEIISSMYQEFNPSVIRALKMLIDGVHQCNKKISICGQMASNVYAVPLLVGLGFDELSVNVHSVLEVKQIIRNIKMSDVKSLAEECLKLKTEKSIRETLKHFYKNHFGVKNNESI